MKRLLFVISLFLLILFCWQSFQQKKNIATKPDVLKLKPLPVEVHPQVSLMTDSKQNRLVFKPTQIPKESILSIANVETLDILSKIIAQTQQDLENEIYGALGTLSYNIVTLFRQSLIAYRQFLMDPEGGPDFNIFYHRPFSGRYFFNQEKISLGGDAFQEGEGGFLVTFFHEYQHYLYHRIYGTPAPTDLVSKFYNEGAAYVFEFLLSSYLPISYFTKDARNPYSFFVQKNLREGNSKELLSQIYDALLSLQIDGHLFYQFMKPAEKGTIDKAQILAAIDETFHPDPLQSKKIQELAEAFYKEHPGEE